MAEQQMISAFASSSNSSSMVSFKKYDVFLSFRGEDTRMNFTSHLYEALKQKKVETFIDYQLKKGDEISPALIEAIEDSHVSIVILSENYASSKWCLEELNKILECKKNQGQEVKPVFYNIDPSNVRKQTGSYEQAFAKHEGDHRCNKWKAALTEVANLAGWDSRGRTESELLKDIVGDVLAVLQKLTPRYPDQLEGLVGIEDNYKQIESLLKIGSGQVRTIGIWGMGGIGKTTLAIALYAKLSHEFDVACFLEDVRENSDRFGLKALCNKLFSELLEEENHCFSAPLLVPHYVMRRLGHKKVLIVLDDVDTIKQLEFLIKDCRFLRSGSRIIVTTRNKHIFHQVVEVYYKVKELSFDHSLQFFCLTVFGEEQPKLGYEDLSRSVISYCRGNPLALKVVGASLRGRSKKAWGSELRKLHEVPHMDIHNVLKISYDGLDRSQKDIFLDVACFFKGKPRDWVTNLLEDCDFFAASGIEVLLDKALITISCCNSIEMHDLIQEMGRKIVLLESINDPGKRSRIWKPKEALEVLKYNRGTDVVEGIILELDTLTENLSLSSDSLAKMTNVRFLKISRRERYMWSNEGFNVYFPNGVESLSYKLRYLHWEDFCLESLPSKFCAEQFVELRMPHNKLTKLWDGIQNLVNLKEIDLDGSRDLIEIPDLSKAEKLESVFLGECESLRELHPSMSSLPNLRVLSINKCKGIESLNVQSKSLQDLGVGGCSSLKEFSVTSVEMIRLDLFATSICAIPSSIWHNRKLRSLSLSGYNNLDELSDDSGMVSITAPDHYGFMQHNASELLSLQALFHNIGHFSSLEMLELTQNNVESLPANIKNLSSLRYLTLNCCRKLVSLLELPPSLEYLDLDDCSKLVSLPVLPPLLKKMSAQNCISLDTDSTQRLVLQHMLQSLIPYYLNNVNEFFIGHFIFLGDHVTDECGFHTAGSSITIPYLQVPPSSHLCSFIYYVILHKELCCDYVVKCYIYQNGKEVGTKINSLTSKNSISDHVFFSYVKTSPVCSDDLPFKLEFDCVDVFDEDKHYHGSKKECGVFPVYVSESGSMLFSSSSKEIFESESVTQISDDESHPRGIGVGASNNENENEWEQLLTVITSSVFF